MEPFDTVQADKIEEGDFILINNEEVEVLSVLDTEDDDEVSLKVYSHSTGEVETLPLVFDETVPLLTY